MSTATLRPSTSTHTLKKGGSPLSEQCPLCSQGYAMAVETRSFDCDQPGGVPRFTKVSARPVLARCSCTGNHRR